MNADRGALSIALVQERRTRNIIARIGELGIGIKASMMAEGRFVNTIAYFIISLHAIEASRQTQLWRTYLDKTNTF